jgi:hypothetical protein
MTKPRSVAATANDNSIPGSRLANESITQDKFSPTVSFPPADNSVTTSKIQDGAVTQQKLDPGISLPIPDDSIVNAKINSSAAIAATKLSYTAAGSGAVARTIALKLGDVVSVKDFGAVGDGIANDQGALQAALSTGKSVFLPSGTYLFNTSIVFTADNQCIYGEGNSSILKHGSGSVYLSSNSRDNICLRNVQVTGNSNGRFIINGSSKVLVQEVYFNTGLQCVWLFTCDHVQIESCTFEGCTYGVIQQANNPSSHVVINGCLALNMTGDFVEANAAGAPPTSIDWVISNNVYSGDVNYPNPQVESRFVGLTNIRNVTIVGNTVTKSAGDAPVHLEDAGGDTIIANNTFDNCLTTFQSGYIYLLNSSEHTVIANNIFKRSDPALTSSAFAVGTGSGSYNHRIQFIGNRVFDEHGTMSGVEISFNTNILIEGNLFDGCPAGVSHNNSQNIQIVGNYFYDCDNPITNPVGPGTTGSRYVHITDNFFTGTTGSNDVFARSNTNGTFPPQDWFVTGNYFCKNVVLTTIANPVNNVHVHNNYFINGSNVSLGSNTNSSTTGNWLQA